MAHRSFYLSCTICVLLSVRPLAAQTRTAMLEATVRDASGAVMPGATVTVVDSSTNQARTFSTDSQGFFRAPELPVGTYDVRVDFPGFASHRQPTLTLAIGQTVHLDIVLAPAGVVETVGV